LRIAILGCGSIGRRHARNLTTLGQEDLGAYRAEALVQRFLQDVVASFEDIAARQGLLSAVDQVGKPTDEIRSILARQLRFLTLSIWPLLIVVGSVFLKGVGAINLDFFTKSTASFGPGGGIANAIVGTGNATKQQVQFMVTRLLRLKTAPEPADAADGVAAALTRLMLARLPRIADELALLAGRR